MEERNLLLYFSSLVEANDPEREAVVFRATVASPWLPDRVATLTPSGDVVLSSDSRRTLDYLEQATLLRPREEPRLVPGADHVAPPAPAHSSPGPRKAGRQTWPKRVKRKDYHRAPPPRKAPAPRAEAAVRVAVRAKRAADPATRGLQDRVVRRRTHVLRTPQAERQMERLSAGRQLEPLTALMNTRLFQTEPVRPPGTRPRLSAQPGLFGRFRDAPVFIVDVFTRYRVRRADVVPLRAADQHETLFTCICGRSGPAARKSC